MSVLVSKSGFCINLLKKLCILKGNTEFTFRTTVQDYDFHGRVMTGLYPLKLGNILQNQDI